MVTWETLRLIIRPWTEDDAASVLPIFSDEQAMQYWNTPPWFSVDEAKAKIRRSLTTPVENHAAWIVILKQNLETIGFINYHHREVTNRMLEIGYIFKRSAWHKGLATEAVSSLVLYCFNMLNVYRIEATPSPENNASINFLKKLGFVFEGGPMRARLWRSDGRSLDTFMFALLASDWPSAK